MSDFEKNRAEYVTHLEQQVAHLQRQLADIKANEKWIPRLGTELDAMKEQARITLSFGGKNQTAVMTYDALRQYSSIDATTNILELGFQSLILDRLREVVEPEVTLMKQAVDAIKGAGKW